MEDTIKDGDVVVITKHAHKSYHGHVGKIRLYENGIRYYGIIDMNTSSMKYNLLVDKKEHARKLNKRELFLYLTYGVNAFPIKDSKYD